MPTAELVAGDVVVRIRPRQVHAVKRVPGGRYHPRADKHGAADHFAFPLSWSACLGLRGVFGDELEVGPALAEWSRAELDGRVLPALELRDDPLGPATGFPFQHDLWDHQTVGAAFIETAGSCVIADRMRLGKTAQTIEGLRLGGARSLPALVVCPNSAKLQWAREFGRWWPGAKVAVATGGAATRRKAIAEVRAGEAQVLVINWESLRAHTLLESFGSAVRATPAEGEPKELNAIPWAVVVADEAHRGAQPRAKQTRALWAVAPEGARRVALTGTPLVNSPEDLWAIMHFVAPHEYPSKTAFLDRYCFVGYNPWGGREVLGLNPKTQDELFGFLDPRLLRRTNKQVGWTDNTRESLLVELTPKQLKAYRQMEEEMVAQLDGGAMAAKNPLTKLTRLRQFAAATCELREDGTVGMTDPSPKVDALMDLIEDRPMPLIAFAQSRELIALCEARLARRKVPFARITGDESDVEKDDAQQAFQEGDVDVCLLTLGAGAEAITLSRARTEVFLQRSYSLREQQQAEMRGVAKGSPVHIVTVEAAGTVEQLVDEVLEGKAEMLEEVVRDRQALADLLRG